MSQWQPIETAPKDGGWILIGRWAATAGIPSLDIPAHDAHLWWAARGQWSERWQKWWDGIEPSIFAQPNVWAPLPSPPA